jgi:hypothetical protein
LVDGTAESPSGTLSKEPWITMMRKYNEATRKRLLFDHHFCCGNYVLINKQGYAVREPARAIKLSASQREYRNFSGQ